MTYERCAARVVIQGTPKCMRASHVMHGLPVLPIDCHGCPMQIGVDSLGTPQLPSMVKRAHNLMQSAPAIIASGFAHASATVKHTRLAVCDTCPLKVGNACSACGCNLKTKAGLATERCPNGYWDNETDRTPAELQPTPVTAPPAYAEAAVFKERTDTCSTCPHRSGRRCGGCTCDLTVMARLAENKCPKGKWRV